jgi:hypothetical protein
MWTEALGSPRLRLDGLDFTVSRIPARDGGIERAARHVGDVLYGAIERCRVDLRRLGETAQLAHELKRCCPHFVLSGRGIEVEESFDVSAHEMPFQTWIVV